MMALQEPQLRQAIGGHLLGFVDEEHRPQQCGLAMGFPTVSKGFKASVAVGRG